MTLTNIEKAAKLMGISINCQSPDDEKYYLAATGFNPYANKADLSDVECALDTISLHVVGSYVHVYASKNGFSCVVLVDIRDHPDKFTARAHAVMAVVEQIYDRRVNNET